LEAQGLLNLLNDAWLPVRRSRSGADTIAPAQLTERLDYDPVVAVDWPRADFRIAALEFLIGLLATACPPADPDAWLEGWRAPPTPEVLQAAFAPIAHAFNLDGDGPRFLQDAEELGPKRLPVERLLIEAPGEKAWESNTDLLVKRNRVQRLGIPAAAMALYTLQSWAPKGGRGNFTGLRGGGPLTTLVLPQTAPLLWKMLWANVACGTRPESADLPSVFPWLDQNGASRGLRVVTPLTVHPLQCWWGMPRRVRLDFEHGDIPIACDITGVLDRVHLVGWRQRPGILHYETWAGAHPLTPVRQDKPGKPVFAVHPQAGGIGYRHWLGLVFEDKDGRNRPAEVIGDWRYRWADAGCGVETDGSRILAAGFDMDDAKARSFVETEMPLPALADRKAQEELGLLAERLVKAAELVASLLRVAVRAALLGDGEGLSSIREQFWERTEPVFFAQLRTATSRHFAEPFPEYAEWLRRLRGTALDLFDEAAPLSADSGAAAPRIAKARRDLLFALLGYDKRGHALFVQLALALPETKVRKGKRG
jgi:CRISPR system Cascade subunit CasA